MNILDFRALQKAGLSPIPIIWDETTKQATGYVEHSIVTPDSNPDDIAALWADRIEKCNGVALKLFPPFFMVDFDLKNTNDKSVFDKWLKAVTSVIDDFTSKVCIEQTRNAGYHVYCKYQGIKQKQTLAKSESGAEVISNYTGGLLSFCYPTPGYSIESGEMTDIEELTQDEFDTINAISMSFNAYTEQYDYTNHKVIDYPIEYESMAMHFDQFCTDKAFEELVNGIGLYEVKGKHQRSKDKYLKYLRKGSQADYSAKVYFSGKKLLLFTSSIPGFPSFHSRIDEHDHSWVLTPTRILYYQCKGNWICTIDRIKEISERYGIELQSQKPKATLVLPADRLRFPFDVFPSEINDFIRSHYNIQPEYIGAFALTAISAAIGNSVVLRANDDYFVKPMLYLVVVAPAGASKTPALNKAYSVIKKRDSEIRKVWAEKNKQYLQELREWEQAKKQGQEPTKPICEQVIIEDSTIEMVVKIMSQNENGCCVLADEMSGFINRMNRYEKSDEVQKWLSIFSGSTLLVQRITRDDNYIENPFCSIAGGIQPGILDLMSKNDNEHNGFYHRFLFCYPEPQDKPHWEKINIPGAVTRAYNYLFTEIIALRDMKKRVLELSYSADMLYKAWFDSKCEKYNKAIDNNTKGIIAKYQDYCLRFSIIIEIINNIEAAEVSESSMEKAIRLTEYFLGNIHKAMQILAPETPVDKLPDHFRKLYAALPAMFSNKTAEKVGLDLGIKQGTVKAFMSRNKALFNQISRGEYEKLF